MQGIRGRKEEDPERSELRGSKLFATIVSNSASGTAKAKMTLVSKFINMKTRGRAVAIGPLEYCGSGIPLTIPRAKKGQEIL